MIDFTVGILVVVAGAVLLETFFKLFSRIEWKIINAVERFFG